MSEKLVETQFGEWRVRVEQPQRRCEGTVNTAASDQCSRRGTYGWGRRMYCHQHHPDWNQWLLEMRRLVKIADTAFRAAVRKAPR
jgi:GMP synthase-like glutamine amidotransferase